MTTSISELSKISEKYKNVNNVNKTIYVNNINEICLELYTSDDLNYRIKILNFLYNNNEELCIEHYHKINVQYMYNPNVEMNEEMLVKIVKYSELPIELKYESAKLIYLESKEMENNENDNNIEKLNKSLDLFLCIASNKEIQEIHSLIRVQILKYLIESERNNEKVKELIYEFLKDEELSQYYRYQVVLEFLENENTKKEYIVEMYRKICLTNIFRTRYVILASQYFLNSEYFKIEDKLEVENIIRRICENEELDYGLRADACDLMITQGITERNRQIAMNILVILGQLGYRQKIISVYNDRQNVHNNKIDESVRDMVKYITSLQLETKEGVYVTYNDICDEIIKEYCNLNNIKLTNNVKNFNELDDSNNNNDSYNDIGDIDDDYDMNNDNEYIISEKIPKIELIKASLLRFSLDRGLYSNFQSIQTLFMKIWQIIKEHEYRETLTQRLFEELIEMSGTCSSGHVSRLVNVLSGFEVNGQLMKLTIDYKDEMMAIVISKINKKISEINLSGKEEDEKYQNNILEEMMWTSNFEKRINFNRFFRENVIQIRDELMKEYVIEQKLMNMEIFEINFKSILEKFEY
jgi:hypothetical protein